MKLLVMIATVAGLAAASPALALEKNEAELNLGSTHPGTVTAYSGFDDERPVTIPTGDELPGAVSQDRLLPQPDDADHFRIEGGGGFDDLPAGFGIDRRIPSK